MDNNRVVVFPTREGRARDPHAAYLAIERFLKASQKPVLIEPGEDPFTLSPDTFAVNRRPSFLTIECWDEKRTLVRRVASVRLERPGRLELEVEHFGGRTGALTLVDLDRETHRDAARKGARLKYRERFRQSLHRQFPDWRVVELSTEQDLHNSFSPAYPAGVACAGNDGVGGHWNPGKFAVARERLELWLDLAGLFAAPRSAQIHQWLESGGFGPLRTRRSGAFALPSRTVSGP